MLKATPQLVSITSRVRLTDEASDKQTFHLELDLSQTDISYAVGDCLAVYPENHPELVEKVLSFFPVGQIRPFHRDFLRKEANLITPSRKLTQQFGPAEYLIDLLPLSLSLDDFCHSLAPMLPRFYSIASSMRVVGRSAHLTVTVSPHLPGAPVLYGTCSDFLCFRAPLNTPIVPVLHHPAPHFRPPAESQHRPFIMIGPGTGVAPFRGFMQERLASGSSPKNWLFFGERTREGHYYYQKDWEAYANAGQLHLDLAFSRDSEQKIYVQHRMLEKSRPLWQWLEEEGAYLFVCGDAKQMAKAVDQTLTTIVQQEGGLSPEASKEYIKNLRHDKRYLRDVY